MEPRFSFNYDGIPFPELNCTVRQEGDDTVYTLPDGLELTCHVQREDDYGIVRWVNSWHNPTDHDSGRITDLYDCDITVPFDPDPPRTRRNRQSTWEPDMLRLWITEGANVSDTDHRLIPHRLWAGDSHHAHCEAGRSGYGTAPFFDVERRGHGILLAVGWSGQWQAYFDRTTDALRIRSGIMYTSFRLHPGESFRTSSVVLLEYRDGQAAAHNVWRRYLRERVSPIGQSGGARGTQCPFSAIFWGGISTEALLRRWQALFDAGLPFDYCWIDAGWYEPLRGTTTAEQSAQWMQTGSWEVSRYYHPDGYRDVTAFLKEHGVRFLLWFEPERVRVDRAWTAYRLGSDPNAQNGLAKLELDSVCEDMIRMTSEHIRDIPIDCYRQDCNIAPLDFWYCGDREQENGLEDRRGTTEIHYINNLYRFWDALLERFPHLLIDDCAGGGHRIDIELLGRSVPLWRSDFQCTWDACPEANQNQNAWAAWWYPYSGIGYGPTLGDLYSFRSAYTAGITVRTWEHADPEWEVGAMGEPLEWARVYFNEYASLRHYFSADFYPLILPTYENTTWIANQYHDTADDTGLILAFRRAMCPYGQATVRLGGLTPDQVYLFTDRDTGAQFSARGADLAAGLTLTIPNQRQSLLLTYHPVVKNG